MRLRSALSVVLALSLSLIASAQLRQGVSMDIAATPLLGDSTVQTHLKLDAAQKSKITEIFQGYSQWAQTQSKNRPKTRQEAMALQKTARDRQLDTAKKALAALNQAQRARLRQLGLQLYGPFTFMAPDVSRELGISPTQTQKMKSIQSQFQTMVKSLEKRRNDELNKIPRPKDRSDQKAMQEYVTKAQALVRKFGPGDQKKIADAKKAAESKLVGTLTPAQQTKWKAMQGPKFNFVVRRRGG